VHASVEQVDGPGCFPQTHKADITRTEGALAVVNDVNPRLLPQLIERIYHAITQSLHGIWYASTAMKDAR
jgi:hypothetical protein